MTIPGKETMLLAIPEICTDKIITLYHSNFVCGTSRSNKNLSYN